MQVTKWRFQEHGDERGQLIALEHNVDIPFEIKRIFYIYGTGENVRRGCHAHNTIQEILVCVHGNCKVLLDDGKERETVWLQKPYEGVYIPPKVWREMYDFSKDAVLLVITSGLYNEDDYVRDYDLFLKTLV